MVNRIIFQYSNTDQWIQRMEWVTVLKPSFRYKMVIEVVVLPYTFIAVGLNDLCKK